LLRTGEDVEPGTAARPRINRCVSDDQRRARRDQLTRIREERRIDGYTVGEVFEVRPTPTNTRNRQPVAPSARIDRRQRRKGMRARDASESPDWCPSDLDPIAIDVACAIGGKNHRPGSGQVAQ
jgi:hypothetical protein